MSTANALGAYIRGRLDELGMSPTQLANMSGVSRSTVYRWLSDKPPETIAESQLIDIARALDVDPTDLGNLFRGQVRAAGAAEQDERLALAQGFVLSHSDLSVEQLRNALEVAHRAAELAAQRQRGRRRRNQ